LILSKYEIREILIANGFKTRELEGGAVGLNPYVYTAVEAVIKAETHQMQQEMDDSDRVRDDMSKILDGVAIALKGESGAILHSWHDLVAHARLLINQRDALLEHCPDAECGECGKTMCPYGDELHFHHDGCPSCAERHQNYSDFGSCNLANGINNQQGEKDGTN
jgi:hypothetical protein